MNLTREGKGFHKKEKDEEVVLRNISKKVYESAVPVYLEKNSILIQKGEKTEAAYFIMSGKLYVQAEFLDGNIYQFSYLEKGAMISDVDVLSGKFINAATLVVAEDVLALKIPLKVFCDELQSNLDFLYYVTTGMAKKMYASSYDKGKNLYKLGIDKVILFIIKNYEVEYVDSDKTSGIRIKKTRDQIASEIGISLKTLNRSIKTLNENKSIDLYKGKITVSNSQYQNLKAIAEQEALY